MKKKLLVFALFCSFSLIGFAQSNSWVTYFNNSDLTINTTYSDCHFPEKGVHNQYILIKLENHSNQDLKVSYGIDTWYNDKKANPDLKEYNFTIPANSSLSPSCNDLQNGLFVFSKMLEPKAKSVLSKFRITNLRINGKKASK